MSEYLDNNGRGIAQVPPDALAQHTGRLIGRNDGGKTLFFSLGFSEPEGTQCLGVKTRSDKREVMIRFCSELATMSLVADRAPQLVGKMATIYGLLRTDSKQPIGILTNDFSDNGNRKVHNHPTRPATRATLREACGNDTFMDFELSRVAIGVGEIGATEEKLVDFHPLLSTSGKELMEYEDRYTSIRDAVSAGRYTLTLPEDSVLASSLL